MNDNRLTPEESAVIEKLSDAWNLYVKLPAQHPMHQQEFAHAIHAAQQQIMSRPTAREEGWVKPESLPAGVYPSYRPLPPNEFQLAYLDIWKRVSNHLPTDEEKEKMKADGYSVVPVAGRDGSGYMAVKNQTFISLAVNRDETGAWHEAFLDWFVRFEAPRQAGKVMGDVE